MKLDWHLWWDLLLTQLCAALRIAYTSRIYCIRGISISMKLGISTKLSSPHSSPQNPVLSDMYLCFRILYLLIEDNEYHRIIIIERNICSPTIFQQGVIHSRILQNRTRFTREFRIMR
ncbi:hypothetical protein BT96DRAFT_723193 [Gymnopus androsaceus JB14]|uniref:Secreted protein n=1 Tax=Gymnopus androsaceus JB14 TaxID=1447944 RepID=A0A6A4HMG0_9AGAR|nr:hypothetical protein BT96DRAFT_723193 [Gymnopus androsaceus JB14]